MSCINLLQPLPKKNRNMQNIFIHDVQSGNAEIESNRTILDYITEYQYRAKNEQVRQLANALGVDIPKLEILMNAGITEASINEYGEV